MKITAIAMIIPGIGAVIGMCLVTTHTTTPINTITNKRMSIALTDGSIANAIRANEFIIRFNPHFLKSF